MRKSHLFATASLFSFTIPAHAAVVGSLSTDPTDFLSPGDADVFILGPDPALVSLPSAGSTSGSGGAPQLANASGTVVGNSFSDQISGGAGGLYQTFVVDSAFTLTQATLLVDDAEFGETVGVRIVSVEDASDGFINAATEITGTLLDTSFTLPAGSGESTVAVLTLDFSLTSAVNLAAGDYAFILEPDGGNNIDWIRTSGDTGPVGVEGGEVDGSGNLNDLFTGRDFTLALTGGDTVIPEPASLALIGMGGLCLLLRRRR